jgi:hypothetical protein
MVVSTDSRLLEKVRTPLKNVNQEMTCKTPNKALSVPSTHCSRYTEELPGRKDVRTYLSEKRPLGY